MKSVKVLGVVFIMVSAFIHTIERAFSMVSSSIVLSGFFSGNNTGEVPQIEVNGFFGNFYVPLFLVMGIVLLIYGFIKEDKKHGY
ncbi:hypothetical protein GN156_00365 [bacterium LRH843]|nr:hypothetical protein [bacterium LRH843]